VIELGTGLRHEGPPKDHLPQWRLEERVAEHDLEPALPFRASSEPATARVVRLVLAFARLT